MQIDMDEQQWCVGDQASVLEVLAQISDRAHAEQRVVISLTIGDRPLTDRDLIPTFLQQPAHRLGPVKVKTQSLAQVLDGAHQSLARYGALLTTEALQLIRDLRFGGRPAASIDPWLGRLADYLECREGTGRGEGVRAGTLHDWANRLLEARAAGDVVMLADLLEYEVLPRLDH